MPRRAVLTVAAGLLVTGACASAPARPVQTAPSSGMMGALALESQDARLGEALLRLAIQRTPGHLAAVADRYARLGVLDTAMDYYAASLKMDPRYVPALDGAARVWRDWGDIGAALGAAYRATYFAPDAPEPWNTLGTILQAGGHPGPAEAAYRTAIARDPGAAYARNNLCYLAFLQGRGDEAREQCAAAVDVDGRLVAARNNLGLVHAASGDRAGAFEAFRAGGSEAAAHYNIGIVLLAEREYDAAVLAFEAAYKADPEFVEAHDRARFARLRARAARETTHGSR